MGSIFNQRDFFEETGKWCIKYYVLELSDYHLCKISFIKEYKLKCKDFKEILIVVQCNLKELTGKDQHFHLKMITLTFLKKRPIMSQS